MTPACQLPMIGTQLLHRQVLPPMAMLYLADDAQPNTKFSGKIASSFTRKSAPFNFQGLRLCELCMAIIFAPSVAKASCPRMLCVFSLGHVLKVIGDIVKLVAVDVINAHRFWLRANKRLSNKVMDADHAPPVVLPQVDNEVSILGDSRLFYSLRFGSPYTAKITDLILPVDRGNLLPKFHTRYKNYGFGRIVSQPLAIEQTARHRTTQESIA